MVSDNETAIAVPEAAEETAPALWGTSDPAAVIQRAIGVADALAPVVRAKGLISSISGKEYPTVEAWTLLGSMLGVFPVTQWTRPVHSEAGQTVGWEARVEAHTLTGAVVGAAEAMCSRAESTWRSRPDFALRSMAQTRATSKALGQPLRFVMQLAGYSPTPAEEMAGQDDFGGSRSSTGPGNGGGDRDGHNVHNAPLDDPRDQAPADPKPRGKNLHVIKAGPTVQANHEKIRELISEIYFKAYQIEHHTRERLGQPTDSDVVKVASKDRVDHYVQKVMRKPLVELTEEQLTGMLEKLSKNAAEAEA